MTARLIRLAARAAASDPLFFGVLLVVTGVVVPFCTGLIIALMLRGFDV